tara:strand:- start:869 stop:1123 length:255 start_codon:yes stop_codon:yes gene_type:complete
VVILSVDNVIFKDWEDFIEIVSYWKLNINYDSIKGYDDRHKIRKALQVIRYDFYQKNPTGLFNQWLENKVQETRDMIQYYEVNE